MNAPVRQQTVPSLVKADPAAPVLAVTGRDTLIVKAGTRFSGLRIAADTAVELPAGGLEPGCDYAVMARLEDAPQAVNLRGLAYSPLFFAGFHVAPGGNAAARSGGDDIPAINPCSLWDLNFRAACPDPRGMALVQKPGGQLWCDIYMSGVNHLADGTSKFGAVIADGNDRPLDPSTGQPFARFDYASACAVMKHHGKGLLGLDEFPAAAFGVTERSAAPRDPKRTGLDAPRTSRFGLMQATGNLWTWGHDGDPDQPRASLFGGSWINDGYAGSRYAYVATYWPEVSDDTLGARGRSDHLQPV